MFFRLSRRDTIRIMYPCFAVFMDPRAMFEIDLKWPIASGYTVRPSAALKGESALYPEDGATITWHRPLETKPLLYREFASLDGSKQSCLGFARRNGLLFHRSHREGDLLRLWRQYVEHLKHVIEFCELGISNPRQAVRQFGQEKIGPLAKFYPSLSLQGPRAPPVLSMRCDSLLGAIQMQAVQSILGGRKSAQCVECSTWFEIGPGARRSSAKFCSDQCKDRFHNRQKREGQTL
jgi:hypothetical protein